MYACIFTNSDSWSCSRYTAHMWPGNDVKKDFCCLLALPSRTASFLSPGAFFKWGAEVRNLCFPSSLVNQRGRSYPAQKTPEIATCFWAVVLTRAIGSYFSVFEILTPHELRILHNILGLSQEMPLRVVRNRNRKEASGSVVILYPLSFSMKVLFQYVL